MILPEGLLSLIRSSERLKLRAYLCPAGIWTIGWGSTGPGIGPGVTWTPEDAESRLMRDASIACQAAANLCPTASGDALAALADFAYNLGATRLAGSTLRRKFNRGDIVGAAEEINRWVYGGGIKLGGLVTRRRIEASMLLGAKA